MKRYARRMSHIADLYNVFIHYNHDHNPENYHIIQKKKKRNEMINRKIAIRLCTNIYPSVSFVIESNFTPCAGKSHMDNEKVYGTKDSGYYHHPSEAVVG